MEVLKLLNVCTNLDIILDKEIGVEGKNSKVYLGRDPQLGEELVIKKIPKKDFLNQVEYFEEAQKLYKTNHPNIMEIQYASQDSDFIYFAMPYLKNGSLNKLLSQRGLTLDEIIKYSLDFLSGLQYIHVKKIVHLDIKPTNLLLSDSNKLIITDFGLSKYVDEHGFSSQDMFYCMHRPPESLLADKVTLKADIYQSGITLYRMCNGNDCLKEQIKQLGIATIQELFKAIISGSFPNRKQYAKHVPQKLIKIINKAIEINPDNRYFTALDMMNDLSSIKA